MKRNLGTPFQSGIPLFGCLLAVSAILGACSGSSIVWVDGSSTVFPITEAMAEEFFAQGDADLRAVIGISGTGGGFQKFCNDEIDIADASRPIKSKEIEACAGNGIDFIELPVAYDGLSVIVSLKNDWVDFFTVEELREIWKPGSTVSKWSDVRPEWPDKKIFLVGADTDSGTFDYFTQVIVGKSGASRPDYTASADDNVLVRAVSEEKFALGYLGFAFLSENTDKLQVVEIDQGSGPVKPTVQTISTGEYAPLSRPLLIYVNRASADQPEVAQFIRFYLGDSSQPLISDVGYVPFAPDLSILVRQRFEGKVTGSVFGSPPKVGIDLGELLRGG